MYSLTLSCLIDSLEAQLGLPAGRDVLWRKQRQKKQREQVTAGHNRELVQVKLPCGPGSFRSPHQTYSPHHRIALGNLPLFLSEANAIRECICNALRIDFKFRLMCSCLACNVSIKCTLWCVDQAPFIDDISRETSHYGWGDDFRYAKTWADALWGAFVYSLICFANGYHLRSFRQWYELNLIWKLSLLLSWSFQTFNSQLTVNSFINHNGSVF